MTKEEIISLVRDSIRGMVHPMLARKIVHEVKKRLEAV